MKKNYVNLKPAKKASARAGFFAPLNDPNISYQTLGSMESRKGSGKVRLHNSVIRTSRKRSGITPAAASRMPKQPIVPISNVPPETDPIPSKENLEIYRLRRRILELKDDLRVAYVKLDDALAVISDTHRAIEKGLQLHLWETYDELMARKNRLKATVQRLSSFDNPSNLEVKRELEEKTRWKRKSGT